VGQPYAGGRCNRDADDAGVGLGRQDPITSRHHGAEEVPGLAPLQTVWSYNSQSNVRLSDIVTDA